MVLLRIFFLLTVCFCAEAKERQLSQITLEDDYLTLLGKDTARWKYVKTEKDWKDIAYFKEIYERAITKLGSSGEEVKIPKIVHFIWVGPKNFPIESIQNVRSWMAEHPDWTFKFWTDQMRPAPCQGMEVLFAEDFAFSYLGEQFENTLNWGQKSDIWRYEILLKEGGVYVDHDANCMQSFEPLHKSFNFYGCLEVPHWSVDGYHVTAGNGLFGCCPNHPVVRGAIEAVLENWERIHTKYADYGAQREKKIVMNTGYAAFTHALHKHLGEDDIVFPPVYFFSTEGLPSLYSHHFYWNAWDDQFEVITPHQKSIDRNMLALRRQNQLILFFLIGSVFFLLCSTLFLLRARR